jgi:gamma-glutamylcyclotransferase (GGCT)/AIG2-like uncharacterized protein YtfP
MVNNVFVYGTLKSQNTVRGLHMFPGARLICETRTADPFFDMADLGCFPAAKPGGTSYLRGELWEVDDETLAYLDEIEGYPDFYRRQIIETDDGAAWMYYLPINDYREQAIRPDENNEIEWRQ